jgi:hypothetical protein
MPKQTKANDAEKEARVNKVYELLVNGFTRYQILQYVTTKTEWKIEARQVDNYIKAANALIANEAEYHRAREIGRAISRLNDLYQKCLKVQDYQRALAAQRELNTLLSLYEPPAPQTLRVMGVDDKLLSQLAQAFTKNGISASDVFNAMLAELEAKEANH